MARDKATREKVLNAAEGLFFERGYDGVSIRDITEAARANVASINYHFGGKRNLYREVLRRRLAPLAQKRISALKGVIEGRDRPDLKEVIYVFVSEFLGEMTSSRDTMNFLNIMHREVSTQGVAADVLVREVIAPIHELLKTAILRARPSLTDEQAALCCISVTGQMFQFIRGRPVIKQVLGRSYDGDFIKRAIDHIVEFSLKGIGV